jgi:hypothetical protein
LLLCGASECDAADYDSACRYAATEGYQVFCYGQDEADALASTMP